MNKIVNGYDLRVGDRVRVVNATIGALGANDCCIYNSYSISNS